MAIQTALDSISQNQGSPFGFKNRIINGGMVIDQRNGGYSGTNAAITTDRWGYYASQSNKVTWQQTPTTSETGYATRLAAGFTNYLSITSSSSYSIGSTEVFGIAQAIEGYNVADLAWGTSNAKSVTISFWVRSSLTGLFSGFLKNGGYQVTGQNTRFYPFGYTINQANTWEYKTVTVPGCPDGLWETGSGPGICLGFCLGNGSSLLTASSAWTSSTILQLTGSQNLVSNNGATWALTGVQFEVGKQATSFDFRPYTTELALCQRYYEMVMQPNQMVLGIGVNENGTVRTNLPIPMSQPKRTTNPSITPGGNLIQHWGSQSSNYVISNYTNVSYSNLLNLSFSNGVLSAGTVASMYFANGVKVESEL